MNRLPRISIITPSYNQATFIEQTILSVLSQDYPDLEYIVMDGGSTDGTLDILKRYSQRLTWISEPDRGQSHAINKGFSMATGEIFAFLNSDDIYEAGALLKVGSFFSAHPEVTWLAGKCRIIDEDNREIRKAVTLYKNLWLRLRSYSVLQVLDYISQPATFWRQEVILKIGLFDETLRYAMDYDYWLRVGQYYKLWVLADYLASYRIHPFSKAGSSANAQFDTTLEISKRYASPVFRKMHALHNQLIITIYKYFFGQEVTQASFPVQTTK